MRSRGERRYRDRLKIKRRLRIISRCWFESDGILLVRQPHRLSKFNLACSCYSCKGKRYSRKRKV